MTYHILKALMKTLIFSGAVLTTTSHASSSEALIKKTLGLSDYKTITYKAEDGTEILPNAFFKLTSSGRSFSIFKSHKNHTAVLSILPVSNKDKADPTPKLYVSIGQNMPAKMVADLDGIARRLGGPGRKPILLSFFFAECAPCIQEIPELNAFAKANKEVDVVAVTFDAVLDAKNFVAKYKLHWPVVANASEHIDKIGVSTYPTLALVSSEGKLVALRSGGLITAGSPRTTDSTLENWVHKSLQSKRQ